MSADINLLLRTNDDSLRQRRRVKILNLIAITSLICIGLMSLSIFILVQIINPPSLKKEQEEVKKRISLLQTRQTALFALNNRVDNIYEVLKLRKDLSRTMTELLAKVPSDLSMENFELDGKSLLVTGQSSSLSVIGEFINNLTDMVRKKEIVKSLTLNSLVWDSSKGTYQVSISSQL